MYKNQEMEVKMIFFSNDALAYAWVSISDQNIRINNNNKSGMMSMRERRKKSLKIETKLVSVPPPSWMKK